MQIIILDDFSDLWDSFIYQLIWVLIFFSFQHFFSFNLRYHYSSFTVTSSLLYTGISARRENGERGEKPLPHAGLLARWQQGHRSGARPAVTVGQPEAPALRQGATSRRRGRRHGGRREGRHRPAPRRRSGSSSGRAAPPNRPCSSPRPQVRAFVLFSEFFLSVLVSMCELRVLSEWLLWFGGYWLN